MPANSMSHCSDYLHLFRLFPAATLTCTTSFCSLNTERLQQTTSACNDQTACSTESDFLNPCQGYPKLPTNLFVLDRQKQGTERQM